MIGKMVVNLLKENKEKIVEHINDKVNIPLVSEANEAKIYTAIADCVLEAIEEVLGK
tara:strand:- start:1943 stop:2113 length:171 start_codon:yes stop_codon:yes gene_type:complete